MEYGLVVDADDVITTIIEEIHTRVSREGPTQLGSPAASVWVHH